MTFAHWELTKGERFKTAKSGIPKTDLDFVTKYTLFREQVEEWVSDPQSPEMFHSYKDPCMQFLLYLLHPVMEKETGLTLLPTYTYFRVYRNGAILEPHTDRSACEVSASMLVNANYENIWPLVAEGNSIIQEQGDILIYRGCEVEHWREPFVTEHGNFHIQLFAHYVDANGPYRMCAGDENRIEPYPTKADIESGRIPPS